MHGNDDTPIWDFVCWAVPTTIGLILVFVLALLIGTMVA